MTSNINETAGALFVVAAPSAAGKSSLIRALMQAEPDLALSISHTTREPRGQEQHGRDYYFVNDAQFDALIEEGAFLEWAHVHSKRYGTTRQAVQEQLALGKDLILEIDYQGAFQVQKFLPQAVLVFILPPSLHALRTRIEQRGEDSPEKIALRLKNAEQEVMQASHFDYVIINDCFEQALFELKSIIVARRLNFCTQLQRHRALFSAMKIV